MNLKRIVIKNIYPHVDGGRYPAKSTLGEVFPVQTILLCDGHDVLRGNLLYRNKKEHSWRKTPLHPLGNDLWQASFTPEKLGFYYYTIEAAIDELATLRRDLKAKIKSQVLESIDIDQGLLLMKSWLPKANSSIRKILKEKMANLDHLRNHNFHDEIERFLEDKALDKIYSRLSNDSQVRYDKFLSLWVEPAIARFSAWYEFFPRSFANKEGQHGTFVTASKHLDYVANLGMNVVYLPPIHPIGVTRRKGKNNHLQADEGDVGSPWAIGSKVGGHKTLHPDLGTLKDFEDFVHKAHKLGISIALDIAFQCSPDHPYVHEHPEWFKKRADGSIQFAENPPKKYEDIYPFDFLCTDYEKLWEELKSIIIFWIEKGIHIFRVDNPHTKPFIFWEWLLSEIKNVYPEVIFLSEAFTRPHIMKHLAKIGFSQSYTYFTWRVHKSEIQEYLEELSRPQLACYFRPNFWPNTPDILSGPLRHGSPQQFHIRFLLAATLSNHYGIYGPAFELMMNEPRDDHSEEYLNSEKYELKYWDLETHSNTSQTHALQHLIRRVNHIRHQHTAFQYQKNLTFHSLPNDHLIAYSRSSDNELILIIINLHPLEKQIGLLDFNKQTHGWSEEETFEIKDLLNNQNYFWQGNSHYIELDPVKTCAHIFFVPKKPTSHISLATRDKHE